MLTEEFPHQPGDRRSLFFQGKMSCIKQMELQLVQIPFVGIRSGSRENLVVLAPDDQCRRLILSQILLPLGIERGIAAIAVKQCELDFLVAGSVEQGLYVPPCIRADRFDVAHTRCVLPFGCIECEQGTQLISLCGSPLFPID